ncbi:hypothetical protein H8U31_001367 [Salmonella enterica]|nr:hypothetical protein [Salmonella enterica]EGC0267616.1 hypothetical protein [Salmonella enterica]
MNKTRAHRNFVGHSAPINRTAAAVMKKGEHWEPDCPPCPLEQDIPYAVMPEWMIGEVEYHTLPNYTGIQRGRLTAYGFYRPARKWACRCSCGRHVLRNTRAIANDKNLSDACRNCRELMFLKREDYFRRTGRHLPYEEIV